MLILLPAAAFVLGALLIMAASMLFTTNQATAIERRLDQVAGRPERQERRPPRSQAVVSMLKQVGEKVPRSPIEMNKLQQRLVQAGFRRPEAPAIFIALRAGLTLGTFLLLITSVLGRFGLLTAITGAGLGYVVSGIVLAKLAKRRQRRIQLGLADALDLMVVCVEAGLGLDQAMSRVADELVLVHPDLSAELRLVNLEMRAGKPRLEALHNLAERTGIEDLSTLVVMLVQTDRFGTSIASSLRVNSETLRSKRHQRAEEVAAKTGVKMVFPLILCIFPAIWVVTIGPAAIRFARVVVPIVNRTQPAQPAQVSPLPARPVPVAPYPPR